MKLTYTNKLRLFLIPFVVIPTIVAVCIGFGESNRVSDDILERQASSVARGFSGRVQVVTDELMSRAKLAASMPLISDAARGLYAQRKDDVDYQLLTIKKNAPNLLDLIITDVSGVVVADIGSRPGGAIYSGFSSEITALDKNDVYISNITPKNSDYDGKYTISVAAPVVVGPTTSRLLVGYVFTVSEVTDILAATNGFENGSFFVCDSLGNAVGVGGTEFTRRESLKPEVKNLPTLKLSADDYDIAHSGGSLFIRGTIKGTSWTWLAETSDGGFQTAAIPITVVTLVVLAAAAIALYFASYRIISPVVTTISNMDDSDNLPAKLTGEAKLIADTYEVLKKKADSGYEITTASCEISGNMLFSWVPSRKKMYLTDNFVHEFELQPENCTLTEGGFLESLMESADAQEYIKELEKILVKHTEFATEYRIHSAQSGLIWCSLKIRCIVDRSDNLTGVVGVVANIDAEKKMSIQLANSASYDFLSQLYNRSTFERELKNEITRSIRARFAIVFIDVDDFKHINDKYGHTVGDEVIRFVARTLKNAVEGCGFAGRFGGDEFIACVTDDHMINNIDELGKKLISVFHEEYRSGSTNIAIKIKISVGISLYPEHGRDSIELIAAADKAMYIVKKHGKSNYRIYSENDSGEQVLP
ncbi:MAG: sensor domain-containing diguanylate cyclase [Oscillospiraceae bacterium]|jgi:diguanylate cyclase (GGDEF)-like protein|nr:sensor domain-containing diguanylate cyclase [Oscillospiraceae bacterium]